MNLKIINCRLDLNIALNHLLFRAKRKDISDEKRKTILRDAEGLNNALEVIKELESLLDTEYRINSKLNLCNMELKKKLLDLQQKEVEI